MTISDQQLVIWILRDELDAAIANIAYEQYEYRKELARVMKERDAWQNYATELRTYLDGEE